MKKQPFTINWQGAISIEEITPRRDALLTALNEHSEVTIDISNAVSFDLASLQLLCSACGSASIRSKRLRLRGAENPVLTQILRANGLNYRENCLRSRLNHCLWQKNEGGKNG